MILTKEIFDQGRSKNGGWSVMQTDALGIPNLVKSSGWIKEIINKDYPEENIKKFLLLKDMHLKLGEEKRKIKAENKIIALNALKPLPVFTTCNKDLPYKDQYFHPNWQKMRLYILERDKYTCTECGETELQLHVHHLKYNWNGFIWEVATKFLKTLCQPCHERRHIKTNGLHDINIKLFFSKTEKVGEVVIRSDGGICKYKEDFPNTTKRELHVSVVLCALKTALHPGNKPVTLTINSKFIINYITRTTRKIYEPPLSTMLAELDELIKNRKIDLKYIRVLRKKSIDIYEDKFL